MEAVVLFLISGIATSKVGSVSIAVGSGNDGDGGRIVVAAGESTDTDGGSVSISSGAGDQICMVHSRLSRVLLAVTLAMYL